jgi:hypothetical protein
MDRATPHPNPLPQGERELTERPPAAALIYEEWKGRLQQRPLSP